jgi:hypothetical protein
MKQSIHYHERFKRSGGQEYERLKKNVRDEISLEDPCDRSGGVDSGLPFQDNRSGEKIKKKMEACPVGTLSSHFLIFPPAGKDLCTLPEPSGF